jgi:hypothetical protein
MAIDQFPNSVSADRIDDATGAPRRKRNPLQAHRLEFYELKHFVVGQIPFGQHDDPVFSPRAADRSQNVRVVCGITPSSAAITSNHQIDAACARKHVFDEPFVPGYIDKSKSHVACLKHSEAEVDRNASLLLFGKPIGVCAVQGP